MDLIRARVTARAVSLLTANVYQHSSQAFAWGPLTDTDSRQIFNKHAPYVGDAEAAQPANQQASYNHLTVLTSYSFGVRGNVESGFEMTIWVGPQNQQSCPWVCSWGGNDVIGAPPGTIDQHGSRARLASATPPSWCSVVLQNVLTRRFLPMSGFRRGASLPPSSAMSSVPQSTHRRLGYRMLGCCKHSAVAAVRSTTKNAIICILSVTRFWNLLLKNDLEVNSVGEVHHKRNPSHTEGESSGPENTNPEVSFQPTSWA